MAVDLNPSSERKEHPIAMYTYDAEGQRIIKYLKKQLDFTVNASEYNSENKEETFLYPSGRITAKVIEFKNEFEIRSSFAYTKHYYIAGKRYASKIGTNETLGIRRSEVSDFITDATAENIDVENLLEGEPDNNTRYKFNGKEFDQETGNYYYGARYYDPKTSLWLSVDPLAEKRDWLSPYNYVQNNPLNRIDPDGKKDIIYDHTGKKTGMENDNWFHNFFYGENYYITDEKGENRFMLGEEGLAVMKSDNFDGFVSDWETSSSEDGLHARITDATDDFDPMKENVVDYVLRESDDGGEMDQKLKLKENKLYGFAGKALNVNEAGNVVWGAAMNVFGMDPFGTYFSAHAGTYKLRSRLDERNEASAAMMGSFYMQNSIAGRKLNKTLNKLIYGEWLKKNNKSTPK